MPDYIGNIEVPEITPSGTFPIVPDYGYGRAIRPDVAVHQFGSGNVKVEQRFLLGNGSKRFSVRRRSMKDSDRIALRNFWESKYGPYGAFTYNAPNDNGLGTTAYTCRFANEPFSWEMVRDDLCSTGVTLIEIPASSPTYTVSSTVLRFPSDALKTALLTQVQQLIPLIRIIPCQSGYPNIYISDRRCTIAGTLYHARLLQFDGIQQGMGNEADQATLTFGNADRVMRDLSNDVDLFRATVEFSLLHVPVGQTAGIKLDLWKGEITDWSLDAGPEFRATAADGLYELNLPYPCRKITRSCWKQFDFGACPYAAQGALDLVHFPSADATKCDKGYDTPNGCLAHGMKRYYGAILAEPQAVRIKDNSTGTWGFGRSTITSVSLVADSIYDQIVPEVYTDGDMPVNAKMAAGRDESDFYEGMGIVCEGPVGFGTGHKIDGQENHVPYSPRTVAGNDPAGATDFFSLDESGNSVPSKPPDKQWRWVYSGNSTFLDNFAAGTAFVVIRRADAKGLQLTRLGEHQMEVIVNQGMKGWVWTGGGVRSYGPSLVNPVWIAVNMLLRARGMRLGADATTEQLDFAETLFDVDAAAAAAICDESVTKLVGSGSETQFRFRGILQEEKPLRDWIQEVLMNCLGYYTFTFGKLKIGVRVNSSAVEAFTEGNTIFGSLQLAPAKPSFNHLTANFADEDYKFVANSVTVYDIDHAVQIGGAAGHLFLKSNVNLSGTFTKSQAARIVSVRMREELGGITRTEWKRAREVNFKTTVLALNTEPGMVCASDHLAHSDPQRGRRPRLRHLECGLARSGVRSNRSDPDLAMAAEPLHIFDPRRNFQTQGFTGKAATTTIHDATETGASISGIFQAAEDFAVLGFWNAYDYYNHLRLKHLPKTDLSGLKLEFDIEYDHTLDGAVRLDAAKYPSVSWDAMTFVCGKGIAPDDVYEVRLLDHATEVSGSENQASVDIDVNGEEPAQGIDYLHLHFRDTRYTITSLDCRFETQLTSDVAPATDGSGNLLPVDLHVDDASAFEQWDLVWIERTGANEELVVVQEVNVVLGFVRARITLTHPNDSYVTRKTQAKHAAQKMAALINTAGDTVAGRFGPDQTAVIEATSTAYLGSAKLTLTFKAAALPAARYGNLGNLDRVLVTCDRTDVESLALTWFAPGTYPFSGGDNTTKYHITLDFTQPLTDKQSLSRAE